MKILIVSRNVLVREGLAAILTKENNLIVNQTSEAINELIKKVQREYFDIIFLQLCKNNTDELAKIKDLKCSGIKSKFIFIDVYNSNEFFHKCLKYGMEGYISGKSSEIEILHIIDQIYQGFKYFDSRHVDKITHHRKIADSKLENLTPREIEILCEIGQGLSNRKISDKFFISEHTVKKHINHIFDKLNIRDRTQVAIYANRCGLVSPVS